MVTPASKINENQVHRLHHASRQSPFCNKMDDDTDERSCAMRTRFDVWLRSNHEYDLHSYNTSQLQHYCYRIIAYCSSHSSTLTVRERYRVTAQRKRSSDTSSTYIIHESQGLLQQLYYGIKSYSISYDISYFCK
jgi:hypothetical protein